MSNERAASVDTTGPLPPSSRYGYSLDVIEAELDHLCRAWQELLPAARRPGSPAAHIVAEIVGAVESLRRVWRGVVREAEL